MNEMTLKSSAGKAKMTALTAKQLDAVAGGSLTDSIPALIEQAIASGAKAILKEVAHAFRGPV